MNCKNCQAELTENSDYCCSCGGKVIRHRMTIKSLFEDFSQTYLNYDNKFLQTFINLFKKPEVVIGSYINGAQKKYVNVISYFALAITISGIQLYILNRFFPESMNMTAWTSKGTEAFQKQQMSFMQEYQSIIMMFYVPIYALISKVVFFNLKKFNYTEQLIIFMYVQAQLSITSAVVSLIFVVCGNDFGLFAMLAIPLMIIYSAYCLKRLYHLNFLEIILRTLLFVVVLSVVLIICIIAVGLVMYFTGTLDAMIEVRRAAKGI